MNSIFKLDSIFNYDIEAMTKELQKILKIQDWEVAVQIVDKYGMEEAIGNKDTLGCCYRNRRTMYSRISLNKDHEEIYDWFSTLLHELYHIVTDDYLCHVEFVFDSFKSEAREDADMLMRNYYERLVDNLSKGMTVALGFEFLEKFRRGGNAEAENA